HQGELLAESVGKATTGCAARCSGAESNEEPAMAWKSGAETPRQSPWRDRMGWASRTREPRRAAISEVENAASAPPPADGEASAVENTGLGMSECLTQLVQPYLRGGESLEDFKTLVSLAASAWNLTTLPERERERAIQKALKKGRIEAAVPFRN